MSRMEPLVPRSPVNADASWGIHGDPTLLVEAARRLRLGIETGVYRSHPPGEYAMFGVARLLDSIAFSMHIGGAVHHTVVSGATEIAHHVLRYLLLPTVPADERAREQAIRRGAPAQRRPSLGGRQPAKPAGWVGTSRQSDASPV